MGKRVRIYVLAPAVAILALGGATLSVLGGWDGERDRGLLTLPLRQESLSTLDPVRESGLYENQTCSMVYDTLLQYRYLERPYELEPALLAAMPEIQDGRIYRFRLKQGVRFHDDPCFPGGVGRELVSADVFYSWKRMADDRNHPKSWSLFENTIVGFDAYRERQNAAETFDYDAPVEGLCIQDDHAFEVELGEPVDAFLWQLAMFQTAVVAREAVEHYGSRFARHPVGTGAFRLASWDELGLTFARNPTYRDERFPTTWMAGDEALGVASAAGKRLPLVERVRFVFFSSETALWERFRDGTLAMTQVPQEFFPLAFDCSTGELQPDFAWMKAHEEPQHNFIFRMFDMQDEVVGGESERARNLRRAITLAIDWNEFNLSLYNGQCLAFDGMISPGLDGAPEGQDHRVKPGYRGLDLARAREYLEAAGYPGGAGLAPIRYYFNSRDEDRTPGELLARQLAEIGVRIELHPLPLGKLLEEIEHGNAQFFGFSYSPDYPDALCFLALFYGPNASPGVNYANYQNPEYDRLFEEARALPPSPERTALYVKMRDIVLEDAVFAGSLTRTRYWVAQPWLANAKPTEMFFNWVKYLEVDGASRP